MDVEVYYQTFDSGRMFLPGYGLHPLGLGFRDECSGLHLCDVAVGAYPAAIGQEVYIIVKNQKSGA